MVAPLRSIELSSCPGTSSHPKLPVPKVEHTVQISESGHMVSPFVASSLAHSQEAGLLHRTVFCCFLLFLTSQDLLDIWHDRQKISNPP